MSRRLRLWRTQVRVVGVAERADPPALEVEIPAMKRSGVIQIPLISLPDYILDAASPGVRFHARVNIGAYPEDDLIFEEWEPR